MVFRSRKRLAFAFALMTPFGLVMTAKAQAADPNQTPLPTTFALDQNGVDLVNWSYVFQVAPISIGPSDQNPLTENIVLPTERDTFSSNLRIQDPSWVTSTRVSASIGPKSWSFLGGGGVAEPGAQVFVASDHAEVYAADGTVVLFTFPSWYTPGIVGPVNFCASKVTKPNGETLTFYNEDLPVQCRTLAIVSNRGYQVRYEYPTTGGFTPYRSKVTLVNSAYDYCDPSSSTCSLTRVWPSISIAITSNSRTYSDHTGRAWTLSTANPGLTAPGESTPGLTWTSENYSFPGSNGLRIGRITSITRAGITWTYTYPSSDPIIGGGSGNLMIVQDPLGNVKRYGRSLGGSSGDPDTGEYEAPNLPYAAADGLGRVVSYGYTAQSLLNHVQYPEGNSEHITYDSLGNVLTLAVKSKTGSGLSDLNTNYTYGTFQGKPLTVTDTRGGVTDYTYDPVHRGILTETGPAPAVGAPRPVKRYAYSQHYAWVKSSTGTYVQAATPIWLLDTEKTCRTSATVNGACAAGATDEVVTTYDYGPNSGPNNLWLRGKTVTADGVTRRTCYGYDPVGNKIWQTSPRAGLTSCP